MIYFQLRYGKQPLELEKGKSTLRATDGAGYSRLMAVDEVSTLETLKWSIRRSLCTAARLGSF